MTTKMSLFLMHAPYCFLLSMKRKNHATIQMLPFLQCALFLDLFKTHLYLSCSALYFHFNIAAQALKLGFAVWESSLCRNSAPQLLQKTEIVKHAYHIFNFTIEDTDGIGIKHDRNTWSNVKSKQCEAKIRNMKVSCAAIIKNE